MCAPPHPLRSSIERVAAATLLVTLAVGTATPQAADKRGDVRALLDRMVQASRTINYVGTFVYRNGSTLQSMKIIHRAEEGGGRQRLVALSGAAREVISDGQWVTCILPDERTVVVTRQRPGRLSPSTVFESEVAIGSNVWDLYSLSSDGTERIADREATVVDVRPRDRYRYGFRLAVDRETGLLLKSELLDGDGAVLEQIVYTHLELPRTIPDEALEPGISDVGFTRYEVAATAGTETDSAQWTRDWTIGWLPAGFRMTDKSLDPIRTGHHPVDHRVYSDGLASLSIFIERGAGAGDRLEGRSSVGAFNAFGRVVDEYQISVVGEVPGVTVEKVAASVTRQ